MLVHSDEDAGHRDWSWTYFVAAGAAIFAPSASLPSEFPVQLAIAALAAVIVVLRGVWEGWRRGRILLLLGGFGLILNSTAIYQWVRVYQHIHRPRDGDEIVRDQERLHGIVRTLEYAQRIHGEYPRTIQELAERIPAVFVADLWDSTGSAECRLSYPVYVRTDDSSGYELFGRGPDCEARTTDDVRVRLSPEELAHTGLRNPG